MIYLITGRPATGKTSKAIEMAMALDQSKPVYTNIVDNTSDKSYLPKSFKKIPCDDWTLIDEPAFIIYDGCEYMPSFCANSKTISHQVNELLLHRHFNHDIVFIFQHEKFAHEVIRSCAQHIYLDEPYR